MLHGNNRASHSNDSLRNSKKNSGQKKHSSHWKKHGWMIFFKERTSKYNMFAYSSLFNLFIRSHPRSLSRSLSRLLSRSFSRSLSLLLSRLFMGSWESMRFDVPFSCCTVPLPPWNGDSRHLDNRTKIIRFPMSFGSSERASERMNERSGVRERSEQCGASEWASGGANGPVLNASISYYLNPLCNLLWIFSNSSTSLSIHGDHAATACSMRDLTKVL